MHTPALIPFATDVKIAGVVGLSDSPALVLSYLDRDGRTLARTVSTPDDIEALARDLLSAAAAARAADPKVVPIGRTPARHARLMRHLTLVSA